MPLSWLKAQKSFMEYYGPCEKNGLTSEMALLSVDGMIHDWATPDRANINEDVNYTGKPLDVNSTWEAWHFMKKHSLNGTIATIPAHRDTVYNGQFKEGSASWKFNVWASTQTVFLDQVSIKSVPKPTVISWIDNSKAKMTIRYEYSLLKMDFKTLQKEK